MSYLLHQAKHKGKKAEEGIEIDLGLSKNDPASIIGTTRETVSRILNDLKKARLISLYDQRVAIHDVEALRRYIR